MVKLKHKVLPGVCDPICSHQCVHGCDFRCCIPGYQQAKKIPRPPPSYSLPGSCSPTCSPTCFPECSERCCSGGPGGMFQSSLDLKYEGSCANGCSSSCFPQCSSACCSQFSNSNLHNFQHPLQFSPVPPQGILIPPQQSPQLLPTPPPFQPLPPPPPSLSIQKPLPVMNPPQMSFYIPPEGPQTAPLFNMPLNSPQISFAPPASLPNILQCNGGCSGSCAPKCLPQCCSSSFPILKHSITRIPSQIPQIIIPPAKPALRNIPLNSAPSKQVSPNTSQKQQQIIQQMKQQANVKRCNPGCPSVCAPECTSSCCKISTAFFPSPQDAAPTVPHGKPSNIGQDTKISAVTNIVKQQIENHIRCPLTCPNSCLSDCKNSCCNEKAKVDSSVHVNEKKSKIVSQLAMLRRKRGIKFLPRKVVKRALNLLFDKLYS